MKRWKKVLAVFAAIVMVIALLAVVYTVHMHYDIEPHVSYEAKVMDAEGRSHDEPSVVYMTHEITPEALMKMYETLDVHPEGKVAVKLSTGEAGNPNYLDPALIKDLVQSLNGTIIECNTAYSGSKRADTAMHRQVAEDHGFTAIADLDIMDENGYMTIPVEGGDHLKENWVGKDLAEYDYVLVLSHFKGHPMGGFGGALKNISIGIASREGKVRIHTGGVFSRPPIDMGAMITNQDVFTDSMAEAAKSVSDYEDHGRKMVYISVMNHLSIDCDCVSTPTEVDMHDIGILASTDPVALDQACVDLVFEAPDGASLQNRILEKNGLNILTHAQKIGLGSRCYELVDVDEESDDDQ
ncbi:MAG: DUF362 domain-containing protein [Lachnospiraceae bacterium]|nr:DUF362 domain-containing protein [Lachnospiraceae bacterium]